MRRTLPGGARWRRHAGVRLTTSLAASAVVAAALTVAGVLLVLLLERSLDTAAEDAAVQRARDVASAVAQDGVGEVRTLGGSTERSVVQVLRGDSVLASSPEIDGEEAMTALRPPAGQVLATTGRVAVGEDDDDHRIVALGVRADDGADLVVVVAQSLETVETSVKALQPLLLAGIPVLVLIVGSATFLLVGRTLRPVEAIRRRVARIDGSQLGQRVPVPAAQDEVGRLAGTMNDMLERLDAAASAQRRFVSDASHELRSPLATVRTNLEVAQVHPEITDWNRLTEIGLEEVARMQALVADMLLLARSDERGLQLRRTEVDLDDLFEHETERLRADGIRVVADVVPVRVLGDRERLARVLRNLADNAARHARTTVGLQLRAEDRAAVLLVDDDGPGIPEQDRLRVFERFVRLDESRARMSGGTGLGLAIVLQIVQAHGGAVTISNSPLGGARFRATIPLSGSDVLPEAHRPPPPAPT